MSETSPILGVSFRQQTWIALLGRRDVPTDGVEDYCIFLGRALATQGIELQLCRVSWLGKGWTCALRELLRESTAWRGKWALVQYTALAWSRRGFPFGALSLVAILRLRGVRVAVVFHELGRQGGRRWIDHLRGISQDWVVRRLYRKAVKAVFTVPVDAVAWLPEDDQKGRFIPIGANIPERVNQRCAPLHADIGKTVIVFGVTEPPNAASEVEEIAGVISEASKALKRLRLVVVGRGSTEAREALCKALERCGVDVVVRGILPADQVSSELERADALLFVRGAISPQRGSAIAAIACGLPIVAYRNGDIPGPLREAGVEWAAWPDRDALARGLIRVLSDPSRWAELHQRNVDVQTNCFSWDRIGERFRMELGG